MAGRQAALPLFPTRGKPRAYRKPKAPPPKEFALHLAVADHLRAFARPDWRWSHYPAGEQREPRAAAKLRAMGLQKGWPDFLLIAPGGRLHALELKCRGEEMTEEQEAFAAWCKEQGVPFVCTDDLRKALTILTGWTVLQQTLTAIGSSERN